MQREETDRFEAISEDGEECTIVEYTRMLERAPMSGAIQRIPAPREYFTDSGLDVNALGDGNFEVLQSGKRYTQRR